VALGTVVVGQSGGPTAVINASLAGVIDASRLSGSHVIGLRNGIDGALRNQVIDLDEVDTKALARTSSAALGSVRYKVKPQDYDAILRMFQAHDVGLFCYIGGNDSMDTAARLAELAQERGLALKVMGVPKTIDNDLPHTDHCPGYPSAARYVVSAVRDIGLDCRAMRRVYVIEIMGREAGWLPAASIMARDATGAAPHIVLLREHVWDQAKLLAAVDEAYGKYGHCVIAAAEGFDIPQVATNSGVHDAFGHVRLSGVAAHLAAIIKAERPALDPVANVLGYMQRSSTLGRSDVDAEEAYQVGCKAVELASRGATSQMVTIERAVTSPYYATLGSVPLARVANMTRKLDPKYVLNDRYDIPESFLDYVAPLVGELPVPVRLY
jgi:6-phosphofructokinase 1